MRASKVAGQTNLADDRGTYHNSTPAENNRLICIALALSYIFFQLVLGTAADATAPPAQNGKIACGGSKGAVYTTNPDGTDLQWLTSFPVESFVFNTGPAFFPDGKRIAFVSTRDGTGEIYTMNTDGSEQKRLTYNRAYGAEWEGAGELKLSVSPDGTKIAFHAHKYSKSEALQFNDPVRSLNKIYVMSVDGDWLTRLSPSKRWGMYPDFSPDGSKIVFMSAVKRKDEIFTMNADGTDQRRLTDNDLREGYPSYSPDGTKIVFHATEPYKWSQIFVMNADGSGLRKLTDAKATSVNPRFSPDGKKIAFISSRFGFMRVIVMNADGTDQKLLSVPVKDDLIDLLICNHLDWQPSSATDDPFLQANSSSLKFKVTLSPARQKTYTHIRVYVSQPRKKAKTLKGLEIELGKEPRAMSTFIKRLAMGRAKRKGKKIGRVKLTPARGVTIKAHIFARRGRIYLRANHKQLRSLRRKIRGLKRRRTQPKTLSRTSRDLRRLLKTLKHLRVKTKFRLKENSLKITRLPRVKFKRIYLSLDGKRNHIIRTSTKCSTDTYLGDTVVFSANITPYKVKPIKVASRVNLTCDNPGK